jgi:hypothetical protein
MNDYTQCTVSNVKASYKIRICDCNNIFLSGTTERQSNKQTPMKIKKTAFWKYRKSSMEATTWYA